MWLIDGIKDIVSDVFDYDISILIAGKGVTVYLTFVSEDDTQWQQATIPIFFDTVFDNCRIPDNEYRKLFIPDEPDFGIEGNEIKIINEIMEYLVAHKTQINELCYGLEGCGREFLSKEPMAKC